MGICVVWVCKERFTSLLVVVNMAKQNKMIFLNSVMFCGFLLQRIQDIISAIGKWHRSYRYIKQYTLCNAIERIKAQFYYHTKKH